MKIKKLVISTLASGFVMWVTAGLWHNLIMANLYKDVTEKHEGIGILLIAYFILALLMTYIYTRFYKKESPIKDGILLGALFGIIWVFPHQLAMAAAHGEPLLYVFKNGIWHIVEQGIGGLIIGVIYKK
jgi:DMSO/TMAO reductase YedYZ heme-binding membrane subunit